MIEAIISLNCYDEFMGDLIILYNVNFNIKKIKIIDDLKVLTMVDIMIDSDVDVDDILRRIMANPHYLKVDFNPVYRDRISAIFMTENCPLSRILAESDCSISSSRTVDQNRMELTFLAIERKSIKRLLRDIEEIGVEPSLQKIIQLTERKVLTARQEGITRMAYEMGYFDFPKRISLKELANKLNISSSNLSEILSKGQRFIMKIYFDNMI